MIRNVWLDMKQMQIKPLKTEEYCQRHSQIGQLEIKLKNYSDVFIKQIKQTQCRIKQYSAKIIKFNKINLKQKQVTIQQIKPIDKTFKYQVKSIICISSEEFLLIYNCCIRLYAMVAATKAFEQQNEIELCMPNQNEDITDALFNQLTKELLLVQQNSNVWVIRLTKIDICIEILKQTKILDYQWQTIQLS